MSVRPGLPMRYGARSWPRSRFRIDIWLLLAVCVFVLGQLAAAGRGRVPPDTAVKAAAAATANDCEAECVATDEECVPLYAEMFAAGLEGGECCECAFSFPAAGDGVRAAKACKVGGKHRAEKCSNQLDTLCNKYSRDEVEQHRSQRSACCCKACKYRFIRLVECQRAEAEAEAAADEAKMDAAETLFGDASEKADVEHNINDPLDGFNSRRR